MHKKKKQKIISALILVCFLLRMKSNIRVYYTPELSDWKYTNISCQLYIEYKRVTYTYLYVTYTLLTVEATLKLSCQLSYNRNNA
jgi:hypothetical protein